MSTVKISQLTQGSTTTNKANTIFVGVNLEAGSTGSYTLEQIFGLSDAYAQAAFLQANTPSSVANSAGNFANGAFLAANSGALFANGSFVTANSGASFANGAFVSANSGALFANGSFVTANSGASFANGAFVTANAAASFANGSFVTANSGASFANGSFVTANSGASFANGSFVTANSGASFANGAFTQANTAANTLPQNRQTTNYVLQTTDAGKHIYYTQSVNVNLFIPDSGETVFANGHTITIISKTSSSANVTIRPNTGVSLFLAGNTTSAGRNVTTYSMATLMCVDANTWFINGTGVSPL